MSALPAASVDAGSASSASSTKKKVDAAESDSKGSDTDSSGDNASSDAADDDKTGSASGVVEQKVVKISLAKGKTSWIEVKVDEMCIRVSRKAGRDSISNFIWNRTKTRPMIIPVVREV